MILVYKSLYRSTELGNWQTESKREREVTAEQFEEMKNSCDVIGAHYSERYNEFFIMHLDRLHATSITVKEGNEYV